MGRNLSRAKSLDKGLVTGHDWPSFSSLLRLLVLFYAQFSVCFSTSLQVKWEKFSFKVGLLSIIF